MMMKQIIGSMRKSEDFPKLKKMSLHTGFYAMNIQMQKTNC